MSPKTSSPLSIELGLLGYLSHGSLHGYEIHQHLMKPDGPGLVWRIKQAQLYAHLGKLEESGLIQSTLQAQESRPTRRVYRLTDVGRDTYWKWITAPVSTPRQIRQEFMVKLYFAKRENSKTVNALIDNQLFICQRWLEIHQEQYKAAPAESFSRSVCEYRLEQIRATQSWLQDLQLKSSAV